MSNGTKCCRSVAEATLHVHNVTSIIHCIIAYVGGNWLLTVIAYSLDLVHLGKYPVGNMHDNSDVFCSGAAQLLLFQNTFVISFQAHF